MNVQVPRMPGQSGTLQGGVKMKLFRDQNGQTLVLTALCMTCFMGFMALAIDMGLVFRTQRNLQTAADAAATAAALDYFYDSGGTNPISAAETVGTNAANSNLGVTGGSLAVTPKWNYGTSISTPWHRQAGFFEVILTENAPISFMGYLGFSSMNVKARAVAGTPNGNSQSCVYVLNSTGNLGPGNGGGGGNGNGNGNGNGGGGNGGSGHGDSTVWLQGSFQVNAPNCGISIDGTSSDTLYYNGNGGSTSAAWIGVVGDGNGGGVGGQYSGYTPQPKVGVAPVSDPFQSYTVPTSASCTGSGGTVSTNTGTIGTYGKVTCLSASTFTNAVFQGTVVFTAPVVTFGGSITSTSPTSDSDLTDGATLVFNTGDFTENAGTVFNLNAQYGGPLPGVVLAAPTTNTSVMQLQFGSSSGTFTGTVYMPDATFSFQDSGGDHSGGLTFNINLIVGQLDDQTTRLNINGNSPPAGVPDPLNLVALVE
jgi:hypothetical protein